MREDRGHDPDYPDREEKNTRVILELVKRLDEARRGHIYSESQGESGWSKYMMPGLVTLVVTGIIGNVIQYAEVSSLKTAFDDFTTSMERRVGNLEQKIYRGAP